MYLRDWENVYDDQGKEIKYSPEKALEICSKWSFVPEIIFKNLVNR